VGENWVVRWGTIGLFPGSANFGKTSQSFYYQNLSYRLKYNNIKLLPSYEVNIESCQQEGGCFPMGEKQPLEGSQPYVHLI
jgi:hypothetical protein